MVLLISSSSSLRGLIKRQGWLDIKFRLRSFKVTEVNVLTKHSIQQTFVLMKTSLRRLSSSSSEDVVKTSTRRLDQDEYIGLTHPFSEDVFLIKIIIIVLIIRLQDVFKTSSRRLAKSFSRSFQNVFKTPCNNVFRTSSRRLQDVYKIHSRRLEIMSSRR